MISWSISIFKSSDQWYLIFQELRRSQTLDLANLDNDISEFSLSLKNKMIEVTEQNQMIDKMRNAKSKLNEKYIIVCSLNGRMVSLIVGLMSFNLLAFFVLLIAMIYSYLL